MNKEKKALRRNISGMMSLDIYLSSLSKDHYRKVVDQVSPKKQVMNPLISWEYFMMSYSNTVKCIQRSKDEAALKSLQLANNWKDNPTSLLTTEFDALVLTNSDLVIEWVNPGFTDMTGYSANFAMGKTPRFLQGENTSNETRKRIREHLNTKRSFKESIVNYRKNRSEYHCEIQVFPLESRNGTISHFLALETELR